jgi:Mor family transcriptional regulator
MQVQIDEGLNVAQLAQRFSLSKRTIFRILSGLNRPNATIHK